MWENQHFDYRVMYNETTALPISLTNLFNLSKFAQYNLLTLPKLVRSLGLEMGNRAAPLWKAPNETFRNPTLATSLRMH